MPYRYKGIVLDEMQDFSKHRGESGDVIVYVRRCKNFIKEDQPDVANSERWLANTIYISKHKEPSVKSAEGRIIIKM